MLQLTSGSKNDFAKKLRKQPSENPLMKLHITGVNNLLVKLIKSTAKFKKLAKH